MLAELDACAQRMFASTDPVARRQAATQLLALTDDTSDGAALLTALSQSSSQYTLLFATQGLVRWARLNEKWLRTQPQRQREVVVDGCGACLRRVVAAGAPRHVVLSVMHCYAQLTKLCFDAEPFLTDAVAAVLELRASTRVGEPLHLAALVLLATLVSHCSRHDSARAQSYMTFATHRRCSNNFRDTCLLDIFRAALDELVTLSTYNDNSNNNSSSNSSSNSVVVGSAQDVDDAYVGAVVELVKECLGYDFMAIRVDESEDAYSAQFPSTWKALLFADTTRQLLWRQHAVLPYPHCATLLSGLGNLCGMRRTIFASPEERSEYLDLVLPPLVHALQRSGLRDDGVLPPPPSQQLAADTQGSSNNNSNNKSERDGDDGRFANAHYVNVFAEACLRFIAPFGYRDLHLSRAFASWVAALRALSLHVFGIRFGDDGSFTTATTLMLFWRGLVTSRRIHGISEVATRDLEYVTPSLVAAFFAARVPDTTTSSNNNNNNSKGSSGDGEVDSDDTAVCEVMQSQSEAMAEVAMLEPAEVMRTLALHLHTRVGSAILDSAVATAWLFYVAGALVRRVMPVIVDDDSNNDSDHVGATACVDFFGFCVECANHRHDASSSSPAAQPQPQHGGGGGTASNSMLVERALLYFLDHVQCILGGDHLSDTLNKLVVRIFGSQAQLFQFVLSHTGHNMLRDAADVDGVELLRSSLSIIGNACRDARPPVLASLTLNLPPVVQLPLAQSPLTYKLRSDVYAVLWPLHATTMLTYAVLDSFLQPIVACIQAHLHAACAVVEKDNNSDNNSGDNSSDNNNSGVLMPLYVAGFLRDLRGVARAVGNDTRGVELFADFVDWCNAYTDVWHGLLAGHAGQSTMVVVAYLRFLQSVLRMRDWASVFAFDPHSARGLRLFKQLCVAVQIIVERHVMSYDVQALAARVRNNDDEGGSGSSGLGVAIDDTTACSDVYAVALKPLTLCMQCVSACVRNDFVPFGAMTYYNDDAYDVVVLGLLSVVRAFPLRVVLQYSRVAAGVAELLRTLSRDEAYAPLTRLDAATLEYVIACALQLCEAEQTSTETLLHALHFLHFIAGFISDVKELSASGGDDDDNNNGGGGGAASNNNNNDDEDGRDTTTTTTAGMTGGAHGGALQRLLQHDNNNNNNNNSLQRSGGGGGRSSSVAAVAGLHTRSFGGFADASGRRGNGDATAAALSSSSALTPPRARGAPGAMAYAMPGSGGRLAYYTPGRASAGAATGARMHLGAGDGDVVHAGAYFLYEGGGGGGVSAAAAGRGGGGVSGGCFVSRVSDRSRRATRRAMAQLLEPMPGLWMRLLSAAMNVIVCQDRALELSSRIVFAIYDVYPPFWYEFVDGLVKSYPARKQAAMQEACSVLTNASTSHEHFYPAMFTFRQRLRDM